MILSHAKIEEIAAAVIKDFNLFFFGEKASEARSMPQGTPIDQVASEYLRLKISFEKLSVLFTAIQSQIQIAADLQEVIKRLNAEPEYRRQRSDAASKLETARRTLKRSQSLYDSLYQNYVEQLMTEQEYVTLKARYKAEAEKAEQLIAALEQEQLESKVYTAENRFLTESRSFMGTDKLTKEMASALVERIYVDADKNIDIRLRYRDEYMALLKFIEGRAAV